MSASVKVDGAKIKRIRLEELVLNRRELARKVGITSTGLWNIEAKPQRCTPTTLRRLAEVLGVPPKELLRTEPIASPDPEDPFGQEPDRHPVPPQGMEPPPRLHERPQRRFRFGTCFVEDCGERAVITIGSQVKRDRLPACGHHVREVLRASTRS